MRINKCMRCMADIITDRCPHCGFDPAAYTPPANALPLGSIVNARYLLGAAEAKPFTMRYAAFDLSLERTVQVVEYLPADWVTGRENGTVQVRSDGSIPGDFQAGVQSFRTNAHRYSSLTDVAGIVHVRDLFLENGTCCCVLDAVPGKPLKEQISSGKPMKWQTAAPLFAGAARALQRLHKARVLHGNIHPGSLILTDTGLILRPDMEYIVTAGSTRTVCASVRRKGYSPPEAFDQAGSLTEASDVYMLAASLVYALTGQAPIQGQKLPVNQQAAAVLQAAMEPDQKKRTASMEAFSQQLASTAKAAPSRKPVWIGLAAAAAAVVLGVGGFFLVQNTRYNQAADALAAGAYGDAQERFEALGGYRDAEEQAVFASEQKHLEAGQKAFDEGRFADAVAFLRDAGDSQDARSLLGDSYMALGREQLEDKTYDLARDSFARAADLGTAEAEVYSTYADGMQSLTHKDYRDAVQKLTEGFAAAEDEQSLFEANEGLVTQLLGQEQFEEARTAAESYVSFCQQKKLASDRAQVLVDGAILYEAESLYDQGFLGLAQEQFLQASEGAVYQDIDRDARLEKLEKHKKLLNMEGNWKLATGKSTLTKNGWIYSYDVDESHSLTLTLHYILNDDDTITAQGNLDWYSCANLSTADRETLFFRQTVTLYQLSMKDVEGVRGYVSVNMVGNQLKIGFASTDGTNVQYAYERTE